MIETRLDMQRAKLESMTRARLRRADELGVPIERDPLASSDLIPPGADPAAIVDADPLKA